MLRAMPGLAIGFDRTPNMVAYARGRGSRVFRADAAAFAVRPASFDAAFCLIDSFRYLLTEEAARAHLRGVARALRPGGIYVVGLEVNGDLDPDRATDAWGHTRGALRVDGEVGPLGDRAERVETIRILLRIRRGTRTERVEDFEPMRVYAREELRALVAGTFEIAGAFRCYDLEHPLPFD